MFTANSLQKMYTMKSVFVLFAITVIITVVSCSPAKQENRESRRVPALPAVQEQTATEGGEKAETAVVPGSAAQSDDAEVMLNPPHGEPFHRCDIPVGAPLNSKPAAAAGNATANPAQVSAPQVSAPAPRAAGSSMSPTIENARRMNPSGSQSQAAVNSGTRPRLNPPHGQPYHRCDIAVGSPLP